VSFEYYSFHFVSHKDKVGLGTIVINFLMQSNVSGVARICIWRGLGARSATGTAGGANGAGGAKGAGGRAGGGSGRG
jgi:hypothetical protein